ncbi:MAG: tRNA (adenosine(37)-N6)-threonylcarbamoyltransferase complex ATPase subunit type 1 TsaE [Alphaproteobacteria bacterium]|nr:tRNA (adenosine(37)-N6)-threonylcarbamoyltransferase complex ATPase subunit type 1 TsaE [Alphaproteobacteria bacterium]
MLLLNLMSEAETEALGRRIAGVLKRGDTIALSGGLGAGKTLLARSIIRHFLPREEVPSPTFTLVQTYEAPAFRISHVDLYRVKDKSEIRELGLDEAMDEGVVLIEWPNRMGELLPRDRLDISFELEDDATERLAKVVARGSWVPRIEKLK